MSDLPTQLRDAITAKLELARAAPGQQWTSHNSDSVAGASVYDEHWVLLYPVTYDHDEPMSNKPGAPGPGYIEAARDQLVAHIAANDPSIVIRHCERDLRVLDRHTPDRFPPADPALWSCESCSHDQSGTDMGVSRWVDWPCPDIVDLAYDLGIPTKEETDGT